MRMQCVQSRTFFLELLRKWCDWWRHGGVVQSAEEAMWPAGCWLALPSDSAKLRKHSHHGCTSIPSKGRDEICEVGKLHTLK